MPSSLCDSEVSLTMELTPDPVLISPSNSPPPSPTPVKSPRRTGKLVGLKRAIPPDPKERPQLKLPEDFEPSEETVVCGRGKGCFEHEGNKRFRALIQLTLPQYTAAKGKLEKSRIVTKTMDVIREKCPQGAFVKQEDGCWWQVSDKYAREKVGAWFRDCLSHRYKSSSKAKHAKKMAERFKLDDLEDLDMVVDDLLSFPSNFESQIKEANKRRESINSTTTTMSISAASGSFYDVDDLCLIPFECVDI